MDPLTIAALGWLMSALINNAVAGFFKWTKTVGLKKESKTLKNELQGLRDVLLIARCSHTDNSFLEELVRDIQPHVYQAVILLEDFENHKKGTEENVNRSKESSPEPSSSYFCFSAKPKTSSFKSNLSQRMKELAEKLQKSKMKLQKAMETRLHFGRNKDHDQQVSLLENEASPEVGGKYGFDISSPDDVSVGGKRKIGQTSYESKMAKKPRSMTEMSQDLINLKAENKKLKEDLDESPVKAIKRFLRSRGFKCAAQLACLDQMKFTIYKELEKLGQVYHFVPEKFGYTPISSKLNIPKDLSEYTWDENKDILYNPNGQEVPSRLQLKNHAPSEVVHMWDKDFWPHDLDSVDTPVGGSPPLDQGYPRGPKARRGLFTKEDMEAQKLKMQPSMMPDGIGKLRFQHTCEHVKFYIHTKRSGLREEEARKELLNLHLDKDDDNILGDKITWSVLSDALSIINQLSVMPEDRKWRLISGVWVEMLGHAAINCKTNYHAKQLSQGGEFLTHLYMLMTHMCIGDTV